MDPVFTYILYAVALTLLAVSFKKSRSKTRLALKKAWKMFLSVLPYFLSILFLTGLLLAILEPATIQRIIGAESGFSGMLLSGVIGAISLFPALIAFPIASQLLDNGAGIVQVAVFISTLTTVGLVTIPLESRYLGRKVALLRNALFFVFSFLVALMVGGVVA